jgi:outer membrane protein TolC
MKSLLGFFLAAILALPAAFADDAPAPRQLTLDALPGLVLGHDTGSAISAQTTLFALHTYQGTIAQALPQVDFNTSYSLLFTPLTESQSINLAGPPPFGIGIDDTKTQDQGTHLLDTKISLSQLLPTAGNLFLSLADTMTIGTIGSQTVNGGAATTPDTQFSQKPKLSLTLSQPLFLNGKLIDFDLFPATLRKAQLGYLEQDSADMAQRNQTVGQAVQLYLSIIQLRKNVAQTRKSIDVTQGNLGVMEKNYSLGMVAEPDLLDARIGLSRQKQALLELASSLTKTERLLAHSIGRDAMDDLFLPDDIPTLAFTLGREEAISRALSGHPLLRQKGLTAEERQVDRVLAGQQYASTLSLSFSWSPRYPFNGSSSAYMTDFGSSFSDFFKDGSSNDYSLAAGLTIHLYDGGSQKEGRAGKAALGAAADQGLLAQRQQVQDQVELDLLQMKSLQEKVALLQEASSLADRRLATEKSLLAMGKSTDLDVASKAADIDARANELWRARADLYLTILDLHSLSGDDLAKIVEGNGS